MSRMLTLRFEVMWKGMDEKNLILACIAGVGVIP